MNTDLAQKRETIEKNKAVKTALHNKILESICEEHGVPGCLAPYVKFNKCSISLTAKDTEALLKMCRIIITNQRAFAPPPPPPPLSETTR